ncbi:hypothetical protein IQ235_01680 [Oscillatoriales cyanobacterium LEGE 11467]|uniref:Uncharacterized protein n=1 Tax=Zarconia navalis LEGE 11467 TaxID=1828826 RepID=A0A928Z6H7_9CYAN|nr:hypothetical protein [Zarconia navalis]MBE9039505.1 hypothetical protein [Zarconia navalis LEGE 11467]
MDVWRCLLTILIILLIVFPSSNLFSSQSANARICQAPRSQTLTWQLPRNWHRENATIPQLATVLAPISQNVPTDDGDVPEKESNGFERAVNLLRSLLWRMTRHLQQLPIESWLADLEANISHKSEEIALEVETLA